MKRQRSAVEGSVVAEAGDFVKVIASQGALTLLPLRWRSAKPYRALARDLAGRLCRANVEIAPPAR